VDPHADVVFLNGKVITIDPSNNVFEAVAVRGNTIQRVGTTQDILSAADEQTLQIDLKGRALLPGFNDCHCHPGHYGTTKLRGFISPDTVGSIEDIQRELTEKTKVTPKGDWIVARGYDHSRLAENRHPNKWDLDAVAPDHKVFITRLCGHVSVANSKTLNHFDITKNTPDPEGGKIDRDQHGEPTGILYEHAQIPIRLATEPSFEESETGMALMNRDFLKNGITSAQDASGRNPNEIVLFQKGSSQIRIYFMVRISGENIRLGEQYLTSGLRTGFGNERLRLGSLKLQMDGAGGSATAAMRTPYPQDPANFGVLHMNQDALDDLVGRGHNAGYQIGVHAIGDRAIEMTLQSFEKALLSNPRKNHRHRIEHCGILDKPLMEKMAELGVVAALGLPFLYSLGDSYIHAFTDEQLQYAYPLKSLMQRGIIAGLSSDAPVIDPNPLYGIYVAVTRKTDSGQRVAPNEAVSVMDALRAYTLHSAFLSFEEHIKGSIEVGKLADLVVLSRDILETPPDDIPGIAVDLTMLDGNIVYQR